MNVRPLYFADEIFYWARTGRQSTVLEIQCELAAKIDPLKMGDALLRALGVHTNFRIRPIIARDKFQALVDDVENVPLYEEDGRIRHLGTAETEGLMLYVTYGDGHITLHIFHDNLVGQMSERKKDAEPLEVSRREISSLLESCDVPKEKLAAFEEEYNRQFGKGRGLAADTVVDQKKFEIEAGENVKISVDPERSDLIEMKKLDGRRAVIVYVEGDVIVNGVEVNI